MFKVYDKYSKKKTKVFFVIKGKKVVSTVIGNNVIIGDEAGLQFYVDDYVAEQIYKFNLKLDGFEPKLELKEGEQLFVPKECEAYKKQKEIEELEKRLNELKAE